jgi:hypothetical protein
MTQQMTTDMIVDQSEFAELLASFMLDDGDLAIERFVSPGEGSGNPFYVSDQPADSGASNWLASATFDASADQDESFDLLDLHADPLDFAPESSHVVDVDFASPQG